MCSTLSYCVARLSALSLCVFPFLSVFSLCVFYPCFLSVLSVCAFCLCFLSGFASYRTTKNDTLLSINFAVYKIIARYFGLSGSPASSPFFWGGGAGCLSPHPQKVSPVRLKTRSRLLCFRRVSGRLLVSQVNAWLRVAGPVLSDLRACAEGCQSVWAFGRACGRDSFCMVLPLAPPQSAPRPQSLI